MQLTSIFSCIHLSAKWKKKSWKLLHNQTEHVLFHLEHIYLLEPDRSNEGVNDRFTWFKTTFPGGYQNLQRRIQEQNRLSKKTVVCMICFCTVGQLEFGCKCAGRMIYTTETAGSVMIRFTTSPRTQLKVPGLMTVSPRGSRNSTWIMTIRTKCYIRTEITAANRIKGFRNAFPVPL